MTDKKSNENSNSSTNGIIVGLAVLLVLFVVLFVNEKVKGGKASGTEVVSPLADDVVIVKYNGGEIKAKDLKGSIAPRVKQLSEEVLEMYKRGAESALVEKLLNEEAKKQGKADIQALLELNKIIWKKDSKILLPVKCEKSQKKKSKVTLEIVAK